MNQEREVIFSRVRGALRPLTNRAPLPDFESELVRMRRDLTVADLWPRFSENLKAVNGQALDDIAALGAFLKSKGWTHGYCDPHLLPLIAPSLGDGFNVETEFDRGRIDDYQFGFTRACGAIAETGTIIFDDRSTTKRLAALAPWAHIAVFKRSEIYPDVPAAISALRQH